MTCIIIGLQRRGGYYNQYSARTRLIIVQSAGRSGSGFASILLSTAAEMPICWHERPPMITDDKWTYILRDVSLFGWKIYCESNYFASLSNVVQPDYYAKGFIENITRRVAANPNHYELDVVQLERYTPLVLRSWLNFIGGQFQSNPLYRPAYITPMDGIGAASVLDAAIQYLVDVHSRMKAFASSALVKRAPNVHVHHARLEHISTEEGALELFDALRLTATEGTRILIRTGQLVNAKRGNSAGDPSQWSQDLGILHEKIDYWYSRYFAQTHLSNEEKERVGRVPMDNRERVFAPELNLE
jgi:hypothetical protein